MQLPVFARTLVVSSTIRVEYREQEGPMMQGTVLEELYERMHHAENTNSHLDGIIQFADL